MKIQKSAKTAKTAGKRGRGRPKKSAAERSRRSNRLTIVCWPEERAALDKAAGDLDTSTWLRELGLSVARARGG